MSSSAFGLLRTRLRIANLAFPAPADYANLATELIALGADARNVYESAQRDWFRRGQTGCVFARLAAYEADSRWPYHVHGNGTLTLRDVAKIEEALARAEEAAEAEVVSILFPRCESVAQFVDLILMLIGNGVFLEGRRLIGEHGTTFEVRRQLTSGAIAWVMAFGPSPCLPLTRQAPFYELVLRVKPKPEAIYHRLNQERAIAHLADYPLVMSSAHWDHRWASTERRTRKILGGDPDDVSAAKSTITVSDASLPSTVATA